MAPGQVAFAWVKSTGVFPIIGARTSAQLDANLFAARIILTDEDIKLLEKVSKTPPVYPHTMNTGAMMTNNGRFRIGFPGTTVR